MATTKFNNLVLAVARRLKAPRTLATDDAGSYTSALIAEYINRSITDLLIENYQKYGEKAFVELFPDYIKTSDVLMLVNGATEKPADCFLVMNLKVSAQAINFTKLRQQQVEDVRNGADKIIVPSSVRPVFWEESGKINTLGITAGLVIARYIQTPDPITPVTVTAGDGNFSTATNGGWTAATRTLVATMNVALSANDVNKIIVFRSSIKIYSGMIETYVGTGNTITLRAGDGLPTMDIPGFVAVVLISDLQSPDLKLNGYWFPEIINKSVQYGIMDAKNSVVS